MSLLIDKEERLLWAYKQGGEIAHYANVLLCGANIVDAVQVVRCKDCVYLGCTQCALATEYNQYRPGVDPDWFCAKGRRPKHETD